MMDMIPRFRACLTKWAVALFIKMGALVEEQVAGANWESICEVCTRQQHGGPHLWSLETLLLEI